MSESNKDLALMKSPLDWPAPVLPIKRHGAGRFPEFAVLLHAGGGFHFLDQSIDAKLDLSRKTPTTPEALIAQGWIVD